MSFPLFPFVVLLIGLLLTLYWLRSIPYRLFVVVYTLSTLYYGVLSVWYWLEWKDGVFLSVDWGGDWVSISWEFVLIACFVFIISVLFDRYFFIRFSKTLTRLEVEKKQISYERSIKPLCFIGFIGLISSVYTYIIGGSLASTGGAVIDDSFALITYQFSDMLIAVCLFIMSKEKVSFRSFLLFLAYLSYTITIGFRYKLVLVAVPIVMSWFILSKLGRLKKFFLLFFSSVAFISFLSVLTISRNKFQGFDFNLISGAVFEDFLYGLFADTNIIFGLASAHNLYGNTIDYVGFQPYIDSITQFVPRFIYPEKNLYQHLWDVNWGIANNLESFYSGTAMPYFGEYYASAGFIGIFIGVLIYCYFIYASFSASLDSSASAKQLITGISLIIVFTAYYYFSRGSFAQIFKGVIFVVLPYFYLCNLTRGVQNEEKTI